jgi:hypothetical protein
MQDREYGLPRIPPYLYMWSSRYVSWVMPKKGAEDGLRISRPRRWLWKNCPSAPSGDLDRL